MIAPPITQALIDVAAERRRQMTHERFSIAHDDQHEDGQLAKAAACYAIDALRIDGKLAGVQSATATVAVANLFPWNLDWSKPKDYRRDLVRAAALLIAEIERVDRMPPAPPPPAPSVPLDASEAKK